MGNLGVAIVIQLYVIFTAYILWGNRIYNKEVKDILWAAWFIATLFFAGLAIHLLLK